MGLLILMLLSIATCFNYFLAKTAFFATLFIIATFALWMLTESQELGMLDKQYFRKVIDRRVNKMMRYIQYDPHPHVAETLRNLFQTVLIVIVWKLFAEPAFEFLKAPKTIHRLIHRRKQKPSAQKETSRWNVFKKLGQFVRSQASDGRFPYNILLLIHGVVISFFVRKNWQCAEKLNLQIQYLHTLEDWLVSKIQELTTEFDRLEVELDNADLSLELKSDGVTGEQVKRLEMHVINRGNWLTELESSMKRLEKVKRQVGLHMDSHEQYIQVDHNLKVHWFAYETDSPEKEKHMQEKINYLFGKLVIMEVQARARLICLKMRNRFEEISEKNFQNIPVSAEEESQKRKLGKLAEDLVWGLESNFLKTLDKDTAQELLSLMHAAKQECEDDSDSEMDDAAMEIEYAKAIQMLSRIKQPKQV